MGLSTVTSAQINNILIDVGVVYLDYGLGTQRILAPTQGCSFEVKQDIKQIDRDGALGKEKGLRRIIKEDATLKVKFMDMSIANLKMVLAGSTATATKVTSTSTGTIASSEYFTNITVIGTDMEGKNKIITLFNPLVDNGLKMDFKDKDETMVEAEFSGHRDPTSGTPTLYTIEEVTSAAPDLTALTVTTATLAPAFSGTTYTYGSNVAQAVASVTVTPTCATADTIKVNGTTVASGVASGAITLTTGINLITITIIKSGYVNKTYTVTINKTVA